MFVVGLLVAVAFVALVGLFVFRPARVLGVKADGLVKSIGSTSEVYNQSCTESGEDTWECRVYLGGASGGTTQMVVETDAMGCWEAWEAEKDKGKRADKGKGESKKNDSTDDGSLEADTTKQADREGCITVFDLAF